MLSGEMKRARGNINKEEEMNKRIALAALLIVFSAVMGFAQGGGGSMDPSRVETYLNQTDEILTNASAVVDTSGVDEAVSMLADATSLQSDAWAHFESDEYLPAFQTSRQARILAMRAVALATGHSGPAVTEEIVSRLLERNDEMIADIGPAVEAADRDELTDLCNSAVDLNDEAHSSFDGGELDIAFTEARRAHEILVRIRSLLAHHGDIAPDRLSEELDRTDEIIAEASEAVDVSGDDAAEALVEQAVELQTQARARFDDGHYRESAALTARARRLAQRALRMVSGGEIDPDMVARQLAITDEAIDRATPIVEDSGVSEAADILSNAVDIQASAQAAYDDGDYANALRLTRQARQLVRRAVVLAGGGSGGDIDTARVAAALAQTDEVIAEVTPIVEDSGNPDAEELLSNAVDAQTEAQASFDDGEYRDAVAQTMAARRLARQAQRLASE